MFKASLNYENKGNRNLHRKTFSKAPKGSPMPNHFLRLNNDYRGFRKKKDKIYEENIYNFFSPFM